MAQMLSREQRKANTDEKIIKSAIKVFGSRGYTNASLTEIAAGAGVSQGLVSQRYMTKENLFIEALATSPMQSFFDTEEKRHLPGALCTYIDHLKDEAVNNREWFDFVVLLHSGSDIPEAARERSREIFFSAPVSAAMAEAQEKGELPAGDIWRIFKVFFRNATNLIKYYMDNSLPVPENKFFLYAIQYNPVERALRKKVDNQKCELQSLQTDQSLLLSVVRTMYPLIIFANISQNTYHMIEYDEFPTRKASRSGTFDELVAVGGATVPDAIQAEQFHSMFDRKKLVDDYAKGNTETCLRHQQTGDDGVVRWMETRVIVSGSPCGDIFAIAMARCIDDEMSRLTKFEEALLKADTDSKEKGRFISELSHNIRTLMGHISGSVTLAQKHLTGNEKAVKHIANAGKAANQLMAILDNIMKYANSVSSDMSLYIVPMDINEVCSTIMLNAEKMSAAKNITIKHDFINMKDYHVYADEVKVRMITANIIANAVKDTAEKGNVWVSCEQLKCEEASFAKYKFRVICTGNGESSKRLSEQVSREDSLLKSEQFGDGVSRLLVKQYLDAMGGSMSVETVDGEGTAVTCVFRFLLRQ